MSGDAQVCGDRQCEAGVVVDPAQDFNVDAVGEVPVGEVGLPGLAGLFGLEAGPCDFGCGAHLRYDYGGD